MQKAKNYQLKTKEESANDITKEIASLIADGFLVFHPTSPVSLKIQIAIQAYKKDPETKFVDQLLKHAQQEIKAIAISAVESYTL